MLATLDQSEEWLRSNGGKKFANTMRANAAKTGGVTIETPNAFIPGEEWVAEEPAAFAAAILEGCAKDDGLLHDHREAPSDTEMMERESLVIGLRHAYGDASSHPDGCVIYEPPRSPGHVDLERIVSTIWHPSQDVQQSRSDFLGQITHASDFGVSQPEMTSCMDLDKLIDEGDVIVLGFDGSRGRVRGKADATALIGCRVEDGHLFEIKVWEQPSGPLGEN
ncbi:hypothetical protein RN2511_036030 [Rhodococcus sp. NKCM2511]|uniref:hypothetical protein n=1 Tax=Rhodococcus sp. NKCM2511 TaxID=2766011 RepID=UPI0019109359|nr:hypothetical protein [Rhodococcus sp. NKCM2511]GHP18867.1 hypothetical protein RN2511_036030 [Rhodococcus sp. NKCM2511]